MSSLYISNSDAVNKRNGEAKRGITKESNKLGKEQDQNSRKVGRVTESLTKKRSESRKSHRHRVAKAFV